jgi:two-component system, chemotaxis family, CheB/CheR fusion protein
MDPKAEPAIISACDTDCRGAADDETRKVASLPFLVVGVGASAGGIDAYKAFFSNLPADTGMAFVLVQHLDPTHESALVSIIGAYTRMPVHLAVDGMEVRPNEIYVIPPDAVLTIKGGILHVARPAPPSFRRAAVNTFLFSLAEDQGPNAIGIILSGFGSDGAIGIGAIKEHGGLTLSQAGIDHHAKSGMPQSAVLSGSVDHVLPVEGMAAALLHYQSHRTIFEAAERPDGIREDLASRVTTICAVLNARLGRDFTQYKSGTLIRRIQRRMHVLQMEDVSAYIEHLRTQQHEANLLFRELLIGVTRFFRDGKAFDALATRVLAGLMVDQANLDPIRVWVAGCAAGEEAYSVAILLKEAKTRLNSRRPIQIFATDIDDRSIEAARAGLYPETIEVDVSAERLAANFVKESGRYRISKDVREMCLFSRHDLTKEPPFSKLQLITCRNLMIYFETQLQYRVLRTFHYALCPGGHLFLGPSEGLAGHPELFSPIDKGNRIFVREGVGARLLPPPMSFSPSGPAPEKKQAMAASGGDIDRRAARVIARYAPAFLVVNRDYDILRFSGDTAKYLGPTTGAASLHLFNLLHPELRVATRAALKQAAATGGRVLHEGLCLEASEPNGAMNLIVEPISDPEEGHMFVVAFQETGAPAAGNRTVAALGLEKEESEGQTEALNRELQTMRERLRNVTEELQSANEELQSSNEEFVSMNEELQSTNEELETSKEEMQSLNEELQTINAELNHRNDSLVSLNSDLANLIDSTSIAILFLDNKLRIRRFTPRVLDIFKIREGDEGRPISDIVTCLTEDNLAEELDRVLRTLAPVEREVALADGSMSYLMQIRPYRNQNNLVDGAVLAFVDLSERKKHEKARARLAAIVDSSQDAIISKDLAGIVTSWNEGAEKLYGYTAAEAIGKPLPLLLRESLPDRWPILIARMKQGEAIAQFDSAWTAKDGRQVEVSMTLSPVRASDGAIVGASVMARNISERKAAERRAALLLAELDHRVKNILAIVSAVVSQTLKANLPPVVFAAEVEGRLKAIAKAHSLLTTSGHGEVSLRDILTTELAPYNRGDGNLTTAGPDIWLTPKAGLTLAMAIHELASNAAKHGALSIPSGRLKVEWGTTGSAQSVALTLAWLETCGPAVAEPVNRGFGTVLIERTLSHEMDAEVNRSFPAEGHRCIITIPLTTQVGRVADNRENGDRAHEL